MPKETKHEIRIVRAVKSSEQPYFSMSRALAQDRSLSWAARGIMAYLLSKPDDWNLLVADLQQECGRDKVYKILSELEKAGYLERQIERDKGKFKDWHYLVHETPIKPFPEKPYTAKPDTANPQLHNRENIQNTESTSSQATPARADAFPELDLPITDNKHLTAFREKQAVEKLKASLPVDPYVNHGFKAGQAITTGNKTIGVLGEPVSVPPPVAAAPAHLDTPPSSARQILAAAKKQAKAEKPPRPRDPVYDAIAVGSYNMKTGKGTDRYIGTLAAGVRNCTPTEYHATLADDLAAMYAWYRANHKGLSAPAKVATICKYLEEWRAGRSLPGVQPGGELQNMKLVEDPATGAMKAVWS